MYFTEFFSKNDITVIAQSFRHVVSLQPIILRRWIVNKNQENGEWNMFSTHSTLCW